MATRPPLPRRWITPGRSRRRTLWIAGAVAAAFFVFEGLLDLKLQDSGDGILAFEVAGTSERAREIVAGWGDDRSIAETQLWIDYPFLVSVSVFMTAAVLAAGDGLATSSRLRAAASAVAWLPSAAGFADAVVRWSPIAPSQKRQGRTAAGRANRQGRPRPVAARPRVATALS